MPEKKRSKYDTDPLDPDFVRRTEEVSGGATRNVERTPGEQARRDPAAEEPTRRLYDTLPEEERYSTSYPSVFVPPVYRPPQQTTRTPPAVATPPQAAGVRAYTPAADLKRTVPKLGMQENVALVLPYAPFYIGLIGAIVELLLVPRGETRVRFHAAQGLALHLAILLGTIFFALVEGITDNGIGGMLFKVAAFAFLIISMIRVWQGKPHHIAPLDDLTQKINQKFEPRK